MSEAQKAQQDQWRRGNTSAQAHKALRNKAVLQYIKEHPGCTKNEIRAALGHGGFELLQRHKLAFYVKANSMEDARWYLESDRPRLNGQDYRILDSNEILLILEADRPEGYENPLTGDVTPDHEQAIILR